MSFLSKKYDLKILCVTKWSSVCSRPCSTYVLPRNTHIKQKHARKNLFNPQIKKTPEKLCEVFLQRVYSCSAWAKTFPFFFSKKFYKNTNNVFILFFFFGNNKKEKHKIENVLFSKQYSLYPKTIVNPLKEKFASF